ncbi:acyltransferase ChoActase/COT/CPT [Punctularia strigosozonata HHB-11173 SS5]|uniref:acyltransferase ChoActase/COT/CPT n=1 Tax=Punctularia strigosozonata (strain HHB-11173) TaxID=741275 RepID=UPI00044164E6|nr:acyltransferase ChoActase/COT/CPT [Punctularia strigosozonata HHB-11173 SS5]EIN13566.1 acyltransferase ChoActase/COT/CPT [Punctularia strigosozonata HHB-11173 SS5]
MATVERSSPKSRTLAYQDKLPKLPIPPLEDTCRRYLRALEGLQSPEEHEATKRAVNEFLHQEGPKLQERLKRYIEDFWYESYLSHSDPVVLALNPFFVLENDPTPDRGSQLPRAASLIMSSLGFIHDLREGILEPDTVRGIPLDMDQYSRLFGTARIPTKNGCKMVTNAQSSHIVVMRRGQFYWFDVLCEENRPLLTEREILRNLQAIVKDADKIPVQEVARNAVGVLSTENRKIWSAHREVLSKHKGNALCLKTIYNSLFIVCLDDAAPNNLAELCDNYLCGTYNLQSGVQIGTCTNRWYDKLQIIVTADGSAGINFEHTGVDGHTVLRYAADVFTEGLMLLARSINPSAPTLFHAPLSRHAKSYKPSRDVKLNGTGGVLEQIDTSPKKLEWELSPELRAGIRFAETRLSDLICQNDCQALEFKGYGKNFITSHGFSPDAFVQMAFQAAYFGLYGRIECTYEPAMTKSFLHGRTEAIRTVQPESVAFVKTFFSDASREDKIAALRKACEQHVKLTRECSKGLGQDRHLYALYCLFRKGILEDELDGRPTSPASDTTSGSNGKAATPAIFTDPGWSTLNTSILSTSNCGNPALRLFGFGPVAADGYGIGYIIKDEMISVCASSKHLQTRRFLDTLSGYLHDVQRILVQLYLSVNERPAPFVDHSGVLRDSKTGRKIGGHTSDEDEDDDETVPSGYSFFDSGEVEAIGRRTRSPRRPAIGKVIHVSEYN